MFLFARLRFHEEHWAVNSFCWRAVGQMLPQQKERNYVEQLKVGNLGLKWQETSIAKATYWIYWTSLIQTPLRHKLLCHHFLLCNGTKEWKRMFCKQNSGKKLSGLFPFYLRQRKRIESFDYESASTFHSDWVNHPSLLLMRQKLKANNEPKIESWEGLTIRLGRRKRNKLNLIGRSWVNSFGCVGVILHNPIRLTPSRWVRKSQQK